MMLRERSWFLTAVAAVLLTVGTAAALVWRVDPYFHYRAPDLRRFRYVLDNQRRQNHGIVRHFDYRALVTGSSMAENFKASDVERLWGLKTVKVAFSGASFRELSRLVGTANACNTNLELVIVALDANKLICPKDWLRTDLGSYPDYLYDDDPLNDISYLMNRDAIGKALGAAIRFGCGGITSFDDYSAWHDGKTRYGRDAVLGAERYEPPHPPVVRDYTAADRKTVGENFDANIRPMIESSREVVFFLTPYSMVRIYHWACSGDLPRRLAAAEQLARAVLEHPRARIFCFGDRMDLVSDLANYRDQDHYGPWVNTRILEWIRAGEGELTRENCTERFSRIRACYRTFDYRTLFEKEGK